MLVAPLLAFSQKETKIGGTGSFHIGGKLYDPVAYGYFTPNQVSLPDNLMQIGGGGYLKVNRWLFGLSSFYQGTNAKAVSVAQPDLTTVDLEYQFVGDVGYAVWDKEQWQIYPRVGIGYEALALEKNLNEDVEYEDGFLGSEYTWASPTLDLGITADFYPLGQSGPKAGLRFGYNLTLNANNDWYYPGGEFENENLPQNNIDGFYLRLKLGGGY